MKVKQKKQDDGKILVLAVASPADVDKAFTKAVYAFARQMDLRPEQGKTIAQIAEEKAGIKDLDSMVEGQALEYLVPFAVDKTGITPSYPPSAITSSKLKRGGDFEFRLYIAPKPKYDLKSYDPVDITVDEFTFDESLVDEQLKQMVENQPSYVEDAPHALGERDICKISLKTTRGDEIVNGLTFDENIYELGLQMMPLEFDKGIIGMNVGETRTFSFDDPDWEFMSDEEKEGKERPKITCSATLICIMKEEDAQISDEWVKKNIPIFNDVAELRASVEKRLKAQQKMQYDEYVRQIAATEISKRFEGKIEDAVYEHMAKNLQKQLRQNLQQANVPYEKYVEEMGGEQQANMMMMMQTRSTLAQGYTLDAVFRHEGLVVTEDDIKDVCILTNPQNPSMVRKEYEEGGLNYILTESAERLRANKWVVEHANISYKKPNEEGEPDIKSEDELDSKSEDALDSKNEDDQKDISADKSDKKSK